MSDDRGQTFDEAFDEWEVVIRTKWLYAPTRAAADSLCEFLAMVRSELASRQRMIDLDRQRFDVLRDDYEKAQVALASTRLAMVEIDRVTRERNEARAEVGHLRLLLGLCPKCGTSLCWYPERVCCDPDCGCGWHAPLVDGEGPFQVGERRERTLRRLADERKRR